MSETKTLLLPRGRSHQRSRGGWWPLLFIGPLFLGVVIFYLWPIVQNAIYSFSDFGAFGGAEPAGVDNYVELFSDSDLPLSIGNTFIYLLIVLLAIPIAFVLAVLLNRPGLKFAQVYRVLFFLPYVAMPAAISMVWRIIFNGDFGVLNWALSLVGIDGPAWLSTPGIAIFSVSAVGLWITIGFDLIIISAAMKGVPTELYEAASLDGASALRQMFSITVPMLSPTLFFLTVITTIQAFQLFDLLYAIMGTTNPAIDASQSIVYLYYQHVNTGDFGMAAAVGVVIMVLIAAFTAMQFRLQRRLTADV